MTNPTISRAFAWASTADIPGVPLNPPGWGSCRRPGKGVSISRAAISSAVCTGAASDGGSGFFGGAA